jgi:hypothetical protein
MFSSLNTVKTKIEMAVCVGQGLTIRQSLVGLTAILHRSSCEEKSQVSGTQGNAGDV